MMTDLDARVAALMEFVDAYADTQFRDEYETHDAEITQARDAAITAIRAELQKPALHEAVSDQETIDAIRSHCLKVTTESMIDMRRTLESFLQGRAKPAQEEITDAERYKELIYAVGNKYPNESRHETALRYIKRAESNTSGPACASKGEKT